MFVTMPKIFAACHPIANSAFFYALLVSVFSYLKDDLSSTALYMVTFFAGILDIDAITLTTARLVNRQILDQEQAVSYVFIALFANTFF